MLPDQIFRGNFERVFFVFSNKRSNPSLSPPKFLVFPTKEKTGLEPATWGSESHLLFPPLYHWATSPWFFTPYLITPLTLILVCQYSQNIPIQSVRPLWRLTFSLVKPMRLLPSSSLVFSQQLFTPLSDYLSENFNISIFSPFRKDQLTFQKVHKTKKPDSFWNQASTF